MAGQLSSSGLIGPTLARLYRNESLRSIYSRLAVMSLGVVSVWLQTYFVIQDGGTRAYAVVGLIASLTALLPFADLGLGYSVINDTIDYRSSRITLAIFGNRLRGSLILLTGSALMLTALSVCALIFGWFQPLLGLGRLHPSEAVAVFGSLLLFAIGIPLGIGLRVLTGQGRVAAANLYGLAGPFIAITLLCANHFLFSTFYIYAWSVQIGAIVVGLVAVNRGLLPYWRQLLPRVSLPSLIRIGTTQVGRTGLSALILTVGMAAAYQTDRLILSHTAGDGELGKYLLVSQVFIPLSSLGVVSAQVLWARFRSALNQGQMRTDALYRQLLLHMVLGCTLAVILIAIVPIYRIVAADRQIGLSVSALAGGAVLLVLITCHQPSAMLLTSSRLLGVSAAIEVAMGLSSVTLTVLLVSRLGAAAPFWSTAIAVGAIQLVPTFLMARHIAGRAEGGTHVAR